MSTWTIRSRPDPPGGVGKYLASDGTPWIDEHVAKEYGALRGTSTFEATDLIIDALDLHHRFPRLWRTVRDLRVRVRFARKISKACRDLTRQAAAAVDAELARTAAYGLPWARLKKILTAAIINADPDLHQARLAAAKFDRRVWLSPDEDGIRTLVIKADQGDQILLYALIERIAEILHLEGDTDPVDIRRAKAAGWLAKPEDLVVLLYRHAGGTPPAGPHDHHPGQPDADDSTEQHGEATERANATDSTRPEPSPEAKQSDEDSVPQPPADYPEPDPNAVEPEWSPGASDRLPPPRSRRYGTEHLPGPEPFPPTWCYQPPDEPPDLGPPDLGPPEPRLGCDVPRLVDYLTEKGLKPARPRVVLNVHLTDQTLLTGDGVVRSDDLGPILLSQLLDLLRDHHCQISLRPVLDPANLAAVDAYEIPEAMREAVRTRHPASVFPFSSRTGQHLELDHTVPHSRAPSPPGSPGQTRVANLGPSPTPSTRRRPTAFGTSSSPTPASICGAAPTSTTSSSTFQGTQALGPMPTPRPTGLPNRPTIVRLDSWQRRHRVR